MASIKVVGKKATHQKKEKDIQREILAWLKSTDLLHWRQNSGWANLGSRMIRLGAEGLPDIFIVVPGNGQLLGMEVKSATGTIRPKQAEFAQRLLNNGGIYRIVRSLEDAIGVIGEYCEGKRRNIGSKQK